MNWIWEPRSGIRKKPISEIQIQASKKYWIRICNTGSSWKWEFQAAPPKNSVWAESPEYFNIGETSRLPPPSPPPTPPPPQGRCTGSTNQLIPGSPPPTSHISLIFPFLQLSLSSRIMGYPVHKVQIEESWRIKVAYFSFVRHHCGRIVSVLRIRDVYSRSWILFFSIRKLEFKNKKREGEKVVALSFRNINFPYWKLFSFGTETEKNEPTEKELKYFYPKKTVSKVSEYGGEDPGSGIRDPEKSFPGPGIKKAPDPGSGIVQRRKIKTIFNRTLKEEWDPELYKQ